MLGLIQPIENEPDCYTAPCHVHPEWKKVLGVHRRVLILVLIALIAAACGSDSGEKRGPN